MKEYDFDDHSFHTHAQQRSLGPAGIIINPPEEAGGHSFIPFNVEDRDFHINILPPTPLELFQLFTPISLVQSWVYYSESWVSHLIQNGVIDSYNSAISNHSRINKWDGLSVAQVYIWLRLLIYLGIHKENTIKSHWSSPSLGVQSPLHSVMMVRRFLCAFFDLSRFNAIRKMLWLIAVHGAPRSLYYQKFLRREIVIAEELDLHLVWAKSRIFIKPLPDFLLNYDFWETNICCEPQLHRAACGLLCSYCGLIRFGHDLQVAQDCHLVNVNLDYRAWAGFARTILPILNPKDSNTMDKRFQYGELRLNRLDTIYRYSPYKFSISSILQGFPHALTESYVPYMDQYNNAVSAFGVVVIVLSAFNLSLAAHSKSPDCDLQQTAYGFAIFTMILCAALIGLFLVLPLISSLTTIYGSMATRKRLAETHKDEDLSCSA